MSQDIELDDEHKWGIEWGTSQTPVRGVRMITFPDGTKSGIFGLDAVMEDLYRQGKPANNEVASEIMERLEGYNYFAPSARHIYKFLLLEEYRRFLEFKSK